MEIESVLFYAVLGIGGLVVLAWLFTCLFTVQQQTVRLIQTFGQFSRVAIAGLNVKLPWPFQSASEPISLRVQQIDLAEQTKTKNDVFVTIHASVQYHVNPERVVDAYFKLENPEGQIKAHVANGIRAKVPTMTLERVFEGKDEIALFVKEELVQTMQSYGYIIDDVLVPNVAPDAKVVAELNNKYASEQAKVTAANIAEAEFTKRVRAAEADAREMEEHGKGVARQRLAISTGARDSLKLLEEAGLSAEQASRYQLMIQFLDTQRSLAENGATKVVFSSVAPTALHELDKQLGMALMQAQETLSLPEVAGGTKRGRATEAAQNAG